MINRTDVISEVLARTVADQPFYRRYANTINASLAAVAGAITALIALWETGGQNPLIVAALVAFIPILTGVTTRLTRNGVSKSVESRVISEASSLDLRDKKAAPAAIPVYEAGNTTYLVAGSYISEDLEDFMEVPDEGPIERTPILDTSVDYSTSVAGCQTCHREG